MRGVEFTFNWLYADDRAHRDVLERRGCRCGRATSTSGLPTTGTGEYEWRGFLPSRAHPHGDRPAERRDRRTGTTSRRRASPAADDNWSYGSVQRVAAAPERARGAAGSTRSRRVVGAMNRPRRRTSAPSRSGRDRRRCSTPAPAPSARDASDARAASRPGARTGSSRLDRDLDGKIDDPGAAIMDAAWPKIADAVMSPVLGPLDRRSSRS